MTTTEGMRKAEILHKSLTPSGYSPLFLQNSSAEIQRRSLPEHRAAVSVLSWISGNIPKLWKTFSHILCCIYSQHNLLPLLTPVTCNVKPQNEQISPGAGSSQNHGHVCSLQHHWMLWQFLTETNSKAWLMFLSLGNKNKFQDLRSPELLMGTGTWNCFPKTPSGKSRCGQSLISSLSTYFSPPKIN